MSKINILDKVGLLSDEDRKEPLQISFGYFTFETCLDLSKPIKIIPLSDIKEVSLEIYTRDITIFISWWTNFVLKDLNGFSGFYHIKYENVGFVVI